MTHAWWQDAAIYQIYVPSFQDSDDDGLGDLPGITQRLDYLQWLGIDAIWLTPFYPSPMEDCGYDIADHCDVDPAYGTLRDFDHLVQQAHTRGIRVVVDFVPNHTSHKHPWFRQSRETRSNPRRDWYIWADGKADGAPPNNWRGQGARVNEGGAWEWDEATDQWYLANFSPAQPELNWNNPHVRAAMLDVLDFWLARDVDGVRIDMVDFLGKDPALHDEPWPTDGTSLRDQLAAAKYQLRKPATLEYIRAMRAVADRHGDKVLIGEVIYHLPLGGFIDYYGDGDLLHLPTNFRLTFLPFDAENIREWVDDYDATLSRTGAWPNYCLGNHDSPRIERLGERQARLAAMLLLTLRGTPFLYYGDEIGMPNVDIPAAQRRDLLWTHPETGRNRDSVRTPMAWTAADNAGFAAADRQPWLPLADDHRQRNVQIQKTDSRSTLELTRRLLALRRSLPALTLGTYVPAEHQPAGCFVYRRVHAAGDMLIALNFTTDPVTIDAPTGVVVASTMPDRKTQPVDTSFQLDPYEGVVVELHREQS